MKKLSLAALPLLAVACTGKVDIAPAIPADKAIETRVNDILSQMTLDDKVGQMCEVNIDLVVNDKPDDGIYYADSAKMAEVLGHYRVGSILNLSLIHH